LGVKEGVLFELDDRGRATRKRDSDVFDVQLYLQFRNESDRPLIIPLPQAEIMKKGVAFLEPSGATGEESPALISERERFYNYLDPFGGLLRGLKTAEPPRNLFVVIEPQAYYEFRDTVTVGIGYKFVERPVTGRPYTVRSINPEYPALKLKYQLPVKNRTDVRDALLKAKTRWLKFGDLVLNSDESFDFVSETILNKLSDY
jgi:hypothetical protein